MKYLFFPLDIGIAHISRSLALAEELKHAGHEVTIAIPSEKQSLYKDSPVNIVDIQPISYKKGTAAFNDFLNINEVVRMINEERVLIKKYKPDWVITDYRLSSLITTLQEKVPVACITGSGGLPFGCKIPNPQLPQMIFKIFSPLIHGIVQGMMKKFYRALEKASIKTHNPVNIEKALTKIPFIIPETPGYLEPKNKNLYRQYMSHLSWKGFRVKKPAWFNRIKPDGRTVYLTFGGTGFDKEKMVSLSRKLINHGLRVIISSGNIADPKDFPQHKNLFVERYLPGFEISKKVDLVLCHGGYGTIIEAVLAEKPVVCIPFNPDQLLHSLRFHELGLGEIAAKMRLQDYISLINIDLQKFEKIGKSTSIDHIVKIVDSVFAQKGSYLKKIQAFKKNHEAYAASINAVKLTENFLIHS